METTTLRDCPSARPSATRRHRWLLHIVDGAAHAPHIEQPDRFLAALAAALG